MSSTTAYWVYSPDYPITAAPRDLKEFFGIPPSPDTQEQLDQNIREKRKVWHQKANKGRTNEGRKFAEAVLSAIGDAEDAIKRGAKSDPSRKEIEFDAGDTTSPPTTMDDLWRRIEMLLFRGRHEDALRLLSWMHDQFASNPRFSDLNAMVILDVANNAPSIHLSAEVLAAAIEDARRALAEFGPGENQVMTLVELLDVAGRAAEADAAYEQGTREIQNPTVAFRLRRLTMMCRKPDWPVVLRFAVDMVKAESDDRHLRSEIVQLFIGRAAALFLPLTDVSRVEGYRQVIDTAAWIADGVPEAEDAVRPHRMWAANADQPVFAGSWQWRALFALLTGFIALPIINSVASKPAWQLVLRGPAAAQGIKRKQYIKKAERAWFLVLSEWVIAAHADVKLPWQHAIGEWPEAQIEFET